jgi:hypothetical protein
MKVHGIEIKFSVAVLFDLAKLKGYKTLNDFKGFSELSPDELLQVIRLCMISGEKSQGREFDISLEELADLLTPTDLQKIIEHITIQNQGEEDKKKVVRRGWYRFRK